jgi:flagellar motor switch protein FliG
VALTGKQKAAMLLMSLDAATAAELLKGVKPDLVQEVAMELACLDASGYRRDKQSTQVARQFCNSLQAEEVFQHKSFLKEMLKSTVGERQAEHIQTQIRNLLTARDPFTRIRFVDSRTLASVLKREHPRAAAAVLSGLPAKKSSDVLGLLGEGIRLSIVSRMTTCENMTAQAKAKMAETVCERLDAVTVDNTSEALPTRLERSLRKVAVILRNLGGELRDCLLGARQRKDDKAGLWHGHPGRVFTGLKPVPRAGREAIPKLRLRLPPLALKGGVRAVHEPPLRYSGKIYRKWLTDCCKGP